MADVVLHIGPHKTATSYIQAVFHHNRGLLEKHGVIYPAIGTAQAQHALAGNWLTLPDLPEAFFDGRSPGALWDRLVARHAGGPETVFLSSENFSRSHPEEVDMRELAECLSAFDTVRIVYTMRRQVELIPSVWAQISKMRFVPSIWSFMRETLEQRRAKGVPVDHNSFYDRLRQGFAPEQIHLLDYGSFKAHPGGVTGVFLDLLGVPLEASALALPSRDEANVSPDPLSLFVASLVADDAARPPDPALVSYLDEVLDEVLGRPRTLLAAHEYRKIHERFRHGNQALVEKVRPVQPGFAFDDGAPPEGLVYRDALDDQAWQKIAAAVYRMPRRARRGLLS